jgi:hypothetical protein
MKKGKKVKLFQSQAFKDAVAEQLFKHGLIEAQPPKRKEDSNGTSTTDKD